MKDEPFGDHKTKLSVRRPCEWRCLPFTVSIFNYISARLVILGWHGKRHTAVVSNTSPPGFSETHK